MARLYIIRHCESEGNACRRTYSQVEAPVTRKGFRQNEMLRRRFSGMHIDGIYSSDCYRAVMTVEPIAKEHGMQVKLRMTLREASTGIWETNAWGNIIIDYPEETEAWSNTPWAQKCPGIIDFKNLADMMTLGVRRIAKEVGPDGVALCVSHSCAIKASFCRWLGKPVTEMNNLGHCENTGVNCIDVDEEGNISVVFMNDDTHLPDELKRGWSGIAGSSVNMAVYPVETDAHMDDLVRCMKNEKSEAGEPFDEEAFRTETLARLKKNPGDIALGYLEGVLTGYVELGHDINVPHDTGILRHVYMMPDFQRTHFAEQFFAYASNKFRYMDLDYLVMPAKGSDDEMSVIDRFIFAPDYALPEYVVTPLHTPPLTQPVLA